MKHFRPRIAWLLLVALLLPAACSSSSEPEAPAPSTPGVTAPDDPFAGGVLNKIVEQAPPNSATQLLAQLASEFGWEPQVAQNPLLKKAVQEGEFKERVEPMLLGLYYKNGFSVLPVVGEGHQFNRDTVVRGAVGSARLFVTTREPVRIIFLRPVQNVQIVYHQDGVEPRVFTVSEQAVVAVRQSLLKQYLR